MTDPRIAVLTAISRPAWHPTTEAHGMPWDDAVTLLDTYDMARHARESQAYAYFATRADEPETDEQRADREETERQHAAGDHEYCGVTCETVFPTEQLRTFVIARGYPGTAGMLHELLRRAREDGRHAPAVTPLLVRRHTVLREAATFAHDAHFNDGLTTPQIVTAMQQAADAAEAADRG
ncbi:hypothetical protein [Streptomyces sp. NPDC016845]|uniref:hypothetical protein n=1 Tax=Streptomyces sp. NPDC016845 TaxID=3364972 RepID=UPI003789DE76